MHSFDDDMELDQITRSAADAYQAPSEPNWDKMQRVLDKELPQNSKRRGGIIRWLAPALLAIGLGIVWLVTSEKTMDKTITQQKTNTPSKAENTENNQSVTDHTLIDHKETAAKMPTAKAASMPSVKSKSAQRYSYTIKNSSENNEAKSIKQAMVSTTPLETVNKEPITRKDAPAEQSTTTTAVISETEQSTTKETSKAKELTATKENNQNTQTSITLKPSSKKGFFIGFTGGFDASTVKYVYSTNAGYNIGGLLGYRFNDRWSVQTGAIFTQKKYKLKGEDFHPPKGSWVSYYDIQTVDGYCKMWDIPILATYHFKGTNNGNSFISVGASSYFMKKENYNYLFVYNNQNYTRNTSYNSTDQHILGLLHLSAGIERPITKYVTAIIEPYAKIPLGGVGYGSIQLSSFGLNFSVQLRQPKN